MALIYGLSRIGYIRYAAYVKKKNYAEVDSNIELLSKEAFTAIPVKA